MAWNKIDVGCKIISFLMLVTVIINWQFLHLLHIHALPIGWYLLIILMLVVFLVSNTLGAVGLFWQKKWGFLLSYFAIIFATLFFSTCYLPFVTRLFPAQDRMYVMVIVNLLMVLSLGALHFLSRRKSRM